MARGGTLHRADRESSGVIILIHPPQKLDKSVLPRICTHMSSLLRNSESVGLLKARVSCTAAVAAPMIDRRVAGVMNCLLAIVVVPAGGFVHFRLRPCVRYKLPGPRPNLDPVCDRGVVRPGSAVNCLLHSTGRKWNVEILWAFPLDVSTLATEQVE